MILLSLVLFWSVPQASGLRAVLTFLEYDACQQWDSHSSKLECASMAKCYGRRLILKHTDGCSDWTMFDSLSSVEDDSMVVAGSVDWVQASDFEMTVNATMDENTEKVNAAIAVGYSFEGTNNVALFENPQKLEQWNLDMINVSNSTLGGRRGNGHVVAVLDSGVAATSAQAFKMLLNGYDFISDTGISMDGNGRDPNSFNPGDASTDGQGCSRYSSWHGTYVSTVLAAKVEEEFMGIAEDVPILPIRVLGKCKMGFASDVADGIAWAIGANISGMDPNRMYPARTIVMAFTGRGMCPSYLQTVISLAVSLNVSLYAAAGNDASASARDHFPANCLGVTSVGALISSGSLASYSSRDASVNMPGGTLEDPVPCLGPTMKVVGCVGTSMSVPHAAGLRALEMTDLNWVDPATLPTPLTSEQLALNYLPHATYEKMDPVRASNLPACSSPSLLYADGFCGIRMDASSDLRTI